MIALFTLLHALSLFFGLVRATGRWVTDPRRGPERHRLNDEPICSLRYKLARGGPTQIVWVNVTGTIRPFHLHLPQGYSGIAGSKPAPVYFDFHGAHKNASEEQLLTSLSDPNINRDGIAVFPEGMRYPQADGTAPRYWLSNPNVNGSITPTDIDYVGAILDCLTSTLNVDPSRIYAMGKSNGGGFVHTLACNGPIGGRFAAFAAVSGAYYQTDESPGIGPCNPAPVSPPNSSTFSITTTPFLEFHGLDDCIAPYNGRQPRSDCPHSWCQQVGVPGFLAQWLPRNGCGTPQQQRAAKHSVTPAEFQGDVEVDTWTCDDNFGPAVKHYRQQKIGHAWPSTFVNDDCLHIKCPKDEGGSGNDQCRKVPYWYNATERILRFWEGYNWPGSRTGASNGGVVVVEGAEDASGGKGTAKGGYGGKQGSRHDEL